MSALWHLDTPSVQKRETCGLFLAISDSLSSYWLFEDRTCHLGLISAVKCSMELGTHIHTCTHTRTLTLRYSHAQAYMPPILTHKCCCVQSHTPKHHFEFSLGNGCPDACTLQTPEPSPQSRSHSPPSGTFHSPRVICQLQWRGAGRLQRFSVGDRRQQLCPPGTPGKPH